MQSFFHINDIIKDVIINGFFDNSSGRFNDQVIFLCLLLPYYYKIELATCFNKVLNIFFNDHSLS